ncbi:MAG: succinyl-diaminopimelate desuccinylase [Rhodobacteraceae bacterium]|nr:succinyl-diaminopimelate desuccinylase [Paracoccaceae bacterium]
MRDPVALTQQLIRCPSVTPEEAGALQLALETLSDAGFECVRVDRNETPNLFARWGKSGPVFGYNGHTDVVPAGDLDGWADDPFGAAIRDGRIWGRGAVDMKSSVAAFLTAACTFVESSPPDGSIIITLTGDEEAVAADGTVAILDWMQANGEQMDVCMVGEPSSREIPGDSITIGRRGSLSLRVRIEGRQGHSAYPELYINPVHAMADFAHRIASRTLDAGTDDFPPSSLALTSIDTGNVASNVVPAACHAALNIRFNVLHQSTTLVEWLHDEIETVKKNHGVRGSLEVVSVAECFLTRPGAFTDLIAETVTAFTGRPPNLSTGGGTSDARFIHSHCPVLELGLVGRTLHQVNENVPIRDILALTELYRSCLESFFG